MWRTLLDQFPATFMCLFLAWFLPWTMSWQYLDVPILAAQELMALLFLAPVVQEFGIGKATLFGFLWGLTLLALGLGVFSIHQTLPPPPLPLFTGLFLLLAAASFFVSIVAAIAPHRAKLAAWLLLFGTYWFTGYAVTHEFEFFVALAAVFFTAGWWMRRRYI